jgi:hypothetical protein
MDWFPHFGVPHIIILRVGNRASPFALPKRHWFDSASASTWDSLSEDLHVFIWHTGGPAACCGIFIEVQLSNPKVYHRCNKIPTPHSWKLFPHGKGKVVPGLNWRRMGEWRYNTTILDLSTRWRWVARFTSPPLYPPEKESQFPEPVWTLWSRENLFPLPRIEPRPSSP